MAKETQIGWDNYCFRKTYWTSLLRAKNKKSAGYQSAVNYLVSAYWKPVYFYIRRKGYDVETAKDLTQSFFTVFLEKEYIKSVDRDKGKFRTFILAALNHFLSREREYIQAKKRGGSKILLSLDFAKAETEIHYEPADKETPEKILTRAWAQAILSQALDRLKDVLDTASDRVYLDVFECYLNTGQADQDTSYKKMAGQFGISETDVRNYLHRVKRKYREYIKDEIRKYVTDEDALKEEMQELFDIL
ncbi:MAG: sigma-70 family RNA polymerase sigma factor [Planctomycetota bacterium]